jgi:hypothetical protein
MVLAMVTNPMVLPDGDGLAGLAQPGACLALDACLDLVHQLLGLAGLAVDEQPPRALREVAPDQQHHGAEYHAQAEADPPADVHRQVVGGGNRQYGPEGRTRPVRSVDHDVDDTPVPAGDQLIDGRVDRGVLPADAEAGQEPEQEEPPRGEGQRGQRGGGEVGAQGDHEQLLAAEPVGEPAEEQRAQARAQHVGRRAEPGHLGLGDVDPAARLGELPGDVADDGYFQAVEYPDGPKADDDHPVPPGPGQAVQTRWNLGGYRPGLNITHAAALPSGGHRQRLTWGLLGEPPGPPVVR